MSKRTRGSSRAPHRRPGSRPTTGRSASRPRAAGSREFEHAEPLASDEVTQAEISASTVAETSARPETAATVRAARAGQARQRVKPGSLLAARAATEYVYVTQDLKRITVLGVLLFGALIVLWLLLVVLRVVPLPFY